MNYSTHVSLLKNINSGIQNNKSLLTDIDTELSKKKIIFRARLTDGTNEYLAKADYSSSPIDFYWQNDKGVPVYIVNYKFIYNDSSEPTAQELYHSTAFDSHIGAMNSDGDDYEAPYITVKSNCDYFSEQQPNNGKCLWVSPQGLLYTSNFDYAPIEIGVSRKFGHHIAADINTTDYDTDPVGIIEGYYYES